MWLWLALASSVLLGLYDVAKKQALARNGVYEVLFGATALTVLFLCPFLGRGDLSQHLALAFKGVLVTLSWVSGMIALKLLPITTVSTLKATRPMFVVVFSIILFGEKLNLPQYGGIVLMLLAIWLLSRSSEKEGISFKGNRGILAMAVSILSGVASALFDKHILTSLGMEPLFVQAWANFYIAAILGVILLVRWLGRRRAAAKAAAPDDTGTESAAFQMANTGEDDAPSAVPGVGASAPAAGSSAAPSPAFRWDWTIVLIAVLITAADALYFISLGQDDALLSVVSMMRRCSVLVTFILGAILFRERRLRGKALSLGLMLGGMALLLFGTI